MNLRAFLWPRQDKTVVHTDHQFEYVNGVPVDITGKKKVMPKRFAPNWRPNVEDNGVHATIFKGGEYYFATVNPVLEPGTQRFQKLLVVVRNKTTYEKRVVEDIADANNVLANHGYFTMNG